MEALCDVLEYFNVNIRCSEVGATSCDPVTAIRSYRYPRPPRTRTYVTWRCGYCISHPRIENVTETRKTYWKSCMWCFDSTILLCVSVIIITKVCRFALRLLSDRATSSCDFCYKYYIRVEVRQATFILK